MVQWLRLLAPSAGGPGSIPGQGTGSRMSHLRILHAAAKRSNVLQLRPGAARKKEKEKAAWKCQAILYGCQSMLHPVVCASGVSSSSQWLLGESGDEVKEGLEILLIWEGLVVLNVLGQ